VKTGPTAESRYSLPSIRANGLALLAASFEAFANTANVNVPICSIAGGTRGVGHGSAGQPENPNELRWPGYKVGGHGDPADAAAAATAQATDDPGDPPEGAACLLPQRRHRTARSALRPPSSLTFVGAPRPAAARQRASAAGPFGVASGCRHQLPAQRGRTDQGRVRVQRGMARRGAGKVR
jgi:hypothetical protein